PLRPYNVTGLDKIRVLLSEKHPEIALISSNFIDYSDISDIINNFVNTDKKIIFTMGKGGVGKTTIAIKIAQALKKRGKK
ncbi:nucleotide-binding protein, partial [Enterococcus faecium]